MVVLDNGLDTLPWMNKKELERRESEFVRAFFNGHPTGILSATPWRVLKLKLKQQWKKWHSGQ